MFQRAVYFNQCCAFTYDFSTILKTYWVKITPILEFPPFIFKKQPKLETLAQQQ